MFLVEEEELKEIVSSDKSPKEVEDIREKLDKDVLIFVTKKEEIYTYEYLNGGRFIGYTDQQNNIRFKIGLDSEELILDEINKPSMDFISKKVNFFNDRFKNIITVVFNRPSGTTIKIAPKVMDKMLTYVENKSKQKDLPMLSMMKIIKEFKKRRLILDMFGNGYFKFDFNHKKYFVSVFNDGTQSDETILKHFGEEELCSISSCNLKEEEYSFLLEQMDEGRQIAYYVIYDLIVNEKIKAENITDYLLKI